MVYDFILILTRVTIQVIHNRDQIDDYVIHMKVGNGRLKACVNLTFKFLIYIIEYKI